MELDIFPIKIPKVRGMRSIQLVFRCDVNHLFCVSSKRISCSSTCNHGVNNNVSNEFSAFMTIYYM